MKRLFFLTLFTFLVVFASSCGEEEPPTRAEKPRIPKETAQRPDVYTVAEVKSATWPSPGDAEIRQFDPVPTRANYLAVLDMSGSMGDADCAGQYASKADAARAALGAWLQSVPRTANIGLVVFSGGQVSLDVPLGVNNREAFMRAVAETQPSGKTPLRDAVAIAHGELERRARYQQGYGDYRIVVITDGIHSEGQDPRPAVSDILNNPANPVLIYTIGFCIEASALHQPGRTMYQSARNPEELSGGLQRVLAESQQFDAIKEFGSHAD